MKKYLANLFKALLNIREEKKYVNPIPVGVAMIPVWHENKLHLLTIKRKNKTANSGTAMPGGYVDNNLTSKEGTIAEADQEVGLKFTPDQLTYYDEYSSKILQPKKPNSTVNIFYKTPVLKIDQVNFDFKDDAGEIEEINMIHWDEENDCLRNMQDAQIELCFPSHQKYALKYLREHKDFKPDFI